MPWGGIQYMELQMIARPKKNAVRIPVNARDFSLDISSNSLINV